MAWTAPSTFVAGAILTAASLNTNVRDNSLAGGPIYATEADRATAIPSPFEGQRAYITASTEAAAVGNNTAVPTGIQTVYNGTQWVCVTSVGTRSNVGPSQTMTASFVDLTIGASLHTVTLRTGTTALMSLAGTIAGNGTYAVISVKTGTVAASDAWGAFNQTSAYLTVGRSVVMTGLTAGLNTFTLQGKSHVIAAITWDYISLAVQGIA